MFGSLSRSRDPGDLSPLEGRCSVLLGCKILRQNSSNQSQALGAAFTSTTYLPCSAQTPQPRNSVAERGAETVFEGVTFRPFFTIIASLTPNRKSVSNGYLKKL